MRLKHFVRVLQRVLFYLHDVFQITSKQDVDYEYDGTRFDLKRGVLTATVCQEICQANDQCGCLKRTPHV